MQPWLEGIESPYLELKKDCDNWCSDEKEKTIAAIFGGFVDLVNTLQRSPEILNGKILTGILAKKNLPEIFKKEELLYILNKIIRNL